MKRALLFLVATSCGEPPTPVTPTLIVDAGGRGNDAAMNAVANRWSYPATRTVAATDMLHGVALTDDYRWLENGKSDDVKKWLGEQDAFARAKLKLLPDREAIAERLRELFYVEAHGVPSKAGNRFFYAKREAGKEKWVVYFREGKAGKEKVLLDPNTWSKDGSVAA